jgi:hypothetical protein
MRPRRTPARDPQDSTRVTIKSPRGTWADQQPADATESNDPADISSIAKKPPQILRRPNSRDGNVSACCADAA